jgi:hypothetical protein
MIVQLAYQMRERASSLLEQMGSRSQGLLFGWGGLLRPCTMVTVAGGRHYHFRRKSGPSGFAGIFRYSCLDPHFARGPFTLF